MIAFKEKPAGNKRQPTMLVPRTAAIAAVGGHKNEKNKQQVKMTCFLTAFQIETKNSLTRH